MRRVAPAFFPLALALLVSSVPAFAQPAAAQQPQAIPKMGQQITPLAPQGSRFEPLDPDLPYDPAFPAGTGWLASHAVTTVVSPDRRTLLILTSGYNRVSNTHVLQAPPALTWIQGDSNEYVFIYDISTPKPIKRQVLQVPYTYNGIVFDPSGTAFYVSGGPSDVVFIVTRSADGTWGDKFGVLPLGHHGVGLGLAVPADAPQTPINERVGVVPCAAGVAISNDGQTLVVANYYDDSISVFTGGLGKWSLWRELDLRPGKNDPSQSGVPGGEYPFWVSVKGNGANATAYVSSLRDREIVVVKLSGAPELFNPRGTPSVTARIRVKGQPNKMTLNAGQSLLYVVEDQSDTVDVIDTAKNTVVETIAVIGSTAPSSLTQYKGANPNSVTLSPDETRLYVTNGNLNCIAVVALGGANSGDHVRPHSHQLVPELGEPQRRRCNAVRGQREVADGPESRLVLWRLRAGGMAHLPANEPIQPAVDESRLPELAAHRFGGTRCAHAAGSTEQPLLQRPERRRCRGVGRRTDGHPARDLHHQGKPDLRPDSGGPGGRKRRPEFDGIWRDHHTE
jgi:YVTN family beta-propeller protein